MLILRSEDVAAALSGRAAEVLAEVENAYRAHALGRTSVPHSSFLRFPDQARDRIIALPAYVGGPRPVAGIKWISSFPGNLAADLPRASAVVVLNSLADGRPEAMLEGSLLSATRTGASAAVAARLLTVGRATSGVTLVGAGVINREVLRYLAAVKPELAAVTVCDLDPGRAARFLDRTRDLLPHGKFEVTTDVAEALSRHRLISLATTATEPHTDLGSCRPGSVVLHVSLRDITPDAILASANVVDDVDHVCRERTSLHLAQIQTGARDFVTATIGDLLCGRAHRPASDESLIIFSPFGLGALDIALAEFVRRQALACGTGIAIPDFLPGPGDSGFPAATRTPLTATAC